MKAQSLIVIVHVADVDASIKYYTEVLGFTVDFKFGDYAGLIYNNVQLHLNGPTNQGIKKAPGSAHFWIDCDEIDTYYEFIRSKGANVVVPLENRIYGVRDCAVNDPDGNTIVFGMGIE
ncbi:MAG TPA: glyoxalase superfamily protein [Mucilaginibacter sp.]